MHSNMFSRRLKEYYEALKSLISTVGRKYFVRLDFCVLLSNDNGKSLFKP